MFIFWGKKRKARRLGRVAEFCPICRDIRPHRVVEVVIAGHIYYISVGDGELVGFELHCEDCGGCRIQEEAPYPHIARDANLNLKDLLVQTNPRLPDRMQERIKLERELRTGRLTPEMRHDLLLEPFLQLNPWVEARLTRSKMDWPSWLGFVASLVLLVVWIMLRDTKPARSNLIANAIGGVAIGLMAFSLIYFATDGERFVRQRVLPLMARALRPLRPSPDELERTIEFLRARRLKIGKHIRPAALERQLKQETEALDGFGAKRLV